MPADNLHVTLKFLGEVPAPTAAAVAAALADVAACTSAFDLAVEGLGAFPTPTRPRVVWAGLGRGASATAGLAGAVDAALARLGFEREARDFSGHVTLGRVREPRRDPALAAALAAGERRAFGTWRVDAVALMKSELHPKGARYTALGRWPLQTFPGETAGPS